MSSDSPIEAMIKTLAKSVGTDVAKELSEYVEQDRLVYLEALITKIARYEGLALAAMDPEIAAAWSEQAKVVTATLEHKLVQERIIAEAKMAAIMKRAILAATAAFGVVLREMINVATHGLSKSIAKGIQEGMGQDD